MTEPTTATKRRARTDAIRHGTALCLVLLQMACTTAPRWETELGLKDLLDGTGTSTESLPDTADLPRLRPGAPRPPYRLGPQDTVAITVWGERDVLSEIAIQGERTTQTTVVQSDGTITLPLLPRIKVEGLTVTEMLRKVADAYRKSVGDQFQVDAQVTKYQSKSVLLDGAFGKGGLYYIGQDLATLGEAISSAGGGLTDNADPLRGVLFRDGRKYPLNYQKAQEGHSDIQDIELRHGDRIFFPPRSAAVYYVFGEVMQQGAFSIPPGGVTLLQGLAQARGPQMLTANMESIYLVRADDANARIYQFSLLQAMANKDLMLQPGDRLFLPPTDIATFDRTIRQILPFFSGTVVIHGLVINP